ncbi:kinase [Streptomyces sp. NPDC017988]|uniref:GHMP family kinase ATP-binding protein n=1 Tax=Streptomyces sp. NPDC017988 TaxID=3365025 RepID=UPI0037908ADD
MLKDAGFGAANGTFGELLQGMLPDAQRFLVTFPLDTWSTAVFRPAAKGGGVSVYPPGKAKSRLLATRMLRAYGRDVGGTLELSGGLAEGKGLASSSADLVATARAVADALDVDLDEETTEEFLRGIEPSDGVMYAGIVSYHHREVRLRERLGFLPPLTVIAHDAGGMVDTVRFNRAAPTPDRRTRRTYASLLDGLSAAIRSRDLPAVGRITTLGARLHLGPQPDFRFDRMRKICREVGGLGLVLAHSGTYLGILLGEARDEDPARIERARAWCAELPGTVSVFRSLGADATAPSPALHPACHAGDEHAL